MFTFIRRVALLTLFLILLVGCATDVEEPEDEVAVAPAAEEEVAVVEPATEAEPAVVRLVTHDSFNVSEEVLTAFEEEHDAQVEIVPLGDAGSMVNQAILSVENPLGDVLFGIDNTFLTRGLEAEIFEPYESENLSVVPETFILDPEHRVTPIDYGDVCLNYDIAYFEEAGLEPPATLEDLIEPEYQGLTVVENPATSSPGLAFLLATVAHFGEDGWESYWEALRANDVFVTAGWSEAYFDHFTAGGGEGSYPIVVSYASSPAAAEGATASVVGDESCFRQIEFAGVLRNAENPELAREFIDFMLSPTFQADVPLQMYVFPVNPEVDLPEAFVQYVQVPETPATVPPEYIEENRDALIERWTEIVLR